MHKSKLAGFIVDCKTPDLHTAAEFWGKALGLQTRTLPGAEGEKYVGLENPPGGIYLEVQKVDHPSRVHLDIETDDLEAEVRRLEELGAVRVANVATWWVMEAPTGQRFCVVNKASANFDAVAHTWED